MSDKQSENCLFFFNAKICRFRSITCLLGVETDLFLDVIFANDLDKLLQSASYVVCIRKLYSELVFYLLSVIKVQLPILSHRLVVSVPVLISTDQQINIVP
jgi:hypothetical protein